MPILLTKLPPTISPMLWCLFAVNEVYSPYLAAHQHQMFIQQGTPHTPHSQTPSIAASPYYNPSPATTTGSHPAHHQTHRTTPLNPNTHSHSIHRQSSQTDGRRSTTSFKNNNHGSDRGGDRDRNGQPNSNNGWASIWGVQGIWRCLKRIEGIS